MGSGLRESHSLVVRRAMACGIGDCVTVSSVSYSVVRTEGTVKVNRMSGANGEHRIQIGKKVNVPGDVWCFSWMRHPSGEFQGVVMRVGDYLPVNGPHLVHWSYEGVCPVESAVE